MDEEPGEVMTEDEVDPGEGGDFNRMKEDEGQDEEQEMLGEGQGEILEEDINLTDSQVMIQLKEAEEEAEALRKEIAEIKAEIDDYQCRTVLTKEDEEHLQEIQAKLMEKLALLDELTKRISKLMELANKGGQSEDTTILDEEEEEGFPDDLLPRVVICSSWDDMMPKVVVCMDMKKPGAGKKGEEGDRDENGLTPEQREALEKERRCMAEERNRLQYQIACMEGEMRVMMRENDMLSRKVAQLKADIDNQPPFEFEMSVSATQGPGAGCPKSGNMDMGYGVMGPNANGNYTMGAALSPGAEVQGKLAIAGPPPKFPPFGGFPGGGCQQPGYQQPGYQQPPYQNGNGNNGQLPCGGISGIPGKSVPCPKLQPQQDAAANDWTSQLPPYGKKCRKDFNASQGNGCGHCQMPQDAGCCGGNDLGFQMPFPGNFDQPSLLPPGLMKQPPMDVNFKVNVQPQSGPCNKRVSMDTDARSNKIAQQLQEIEMELRRMQRDLCKAKKDKETLKAQQATLNCAKNSIL